MADNMHNFFSTIKFSIDFLQISICFLNLCFSSIFKTIKAFTIAGKIPPNPSSPFNLSKIHLYIFSLHFSLKSLEKNFGKNNLKILSKYLKKTENFYYLQV